MKTRTVHFGFLTAKISERFVKIEYAGNMGSSISRNVAPACEHVLGYNPYEKLVLTKESGSPSYLYTAEFAI